jgi:REP element-mobilizing transposase RayT
MVRGIERKAIFRDDADGDSFVERLGRVLLESRTECFALALLPDHVHLFLRTGLSPIATVMRRLLTDHASQFNRRHRRRWQAFRSPPPAGRSSAVKRC